MVTNDRTTERRLPLLVSMLAMATVLLFYLIVTIVQLDRVREAVHRFTLAWQQTRIDSVRVLFRESGTTRYVEELALEIQSDWAAGLAMAEEAGHTLRELERSILRLRVPMSLIRTLEESTNQYQNDAREALHRFRSLMDVPAGRTLLAAGILHQGQLARQLDDLEPSIRIQLVLLQNEIEALDYGGHEITKGAVRLSEHVRITGNRIRSFSIIVMAALLLLIVPLAVQIRRSYRQLRSYRTFRAKFLRERTLEELRSCIEKHQSDAVDALLWELAAGRTADVKDAGGGCLLLVVSVDGEIPSHAHPIHFESTPRDGAYEAIQLDEYILSVRFDPGHPAAKSDVSAEAIHNDVTSRTERSLVSFYGRVDSGSSPSTLLSSIESRLHSLYRYAPGDLIEVPPRIRSVDTEVSFDVTSHRSRWMELLERMKHAIDSRDAESAKTLVDELLDSSRSLSRTGFQMIETLITGSLQRSLDSIRPGQLSQRVRAGAFRASRQPTIEAARRSFHRVVGEIVSQWPDTEEKHVMLADQVRDIVHRDTADPTLCLATIADELGYSSGFVGRTFRKVTGNSVQSEINSRRVQAVAEFIREYRLPIGAAFDRAGVSNHSHFYGVFRKHFGVTPGEFARLAAMESRASV